MIGLACRLPGGQVQLEMPKPRLALLRAVQSDPDLTATYFDMVAGAASATALYTPKLLALL